MEIMHKVGRTLSDIIEIIRGEVYISRTGGCSRLTTLRYVMGALSEVYVKRTHCGPSEVWANIDAWIERERIERLTAPVKVAPVTRPIVVKPTSFLVNPLALDSSGPFTAWYEGDNGAALRASETARVHTQVKAVKRSRNELARLITRG
jgi:hypothetical protein